MEYFAVTGGRPLEGSAVIHGAKNSALPILRHSAQNESDDVCREAARALVRRYMLTAL